MFRSFGYLIKMYKVIIRCLEALDTLLRCMRLLYMVFRSFGCLIKMYEVIIRCLEALDTLLRCMRLL